MGPYTAGMKASAWQILRVGLLIQGSFLLAHPTAELLHELGHALPVWFTGGTIDAIIVHPLSWSYTQYGTTPVYPVLSTWSGSLFAFVTSTVLFLLAWRWWRPVLAPLLLLGVLGGVDNGIYLLGSLGDPAQLIELGQPAWLVRGVGLLLLLAGLAMGVMVLPTIGLFTTFGGRARTLAILIGIGPHMAVTAIYNSVLFPEQAAYWVTGAAIGFALLPAAGWGSVWLQRRWPWLTRKPSSIVGWRIVMVLNVLGVLLYAALLSLQPEHIDSHTYEPPEEQRLTLAITAGRVDEVRERLATSAVIDWGGDGFPLVHWAALCHEDDQTAINILEVMIEYGGDLNTQSPLRGLTSLHWAAMRKRPVLVQWLLKHGADPALRAADGGTMLTYACRGGSVEVARLLLDAGADIAAAEDGGITALHLAAREGHRDVVQLLVERGADPMAHDYEGRTPADLADAHGHGGLASWLRERESAFFGKAIGEEPLTQPSSQDH